MTISRLLLGPSLLLAYLSTGGCATTGSPDGGPAHDNTDAVLWVQASTEYAAVTTSIYATATAALVQIAKDEPDQVSRMAIVMDIDETVLDNSSYQGQLIFDDATYEGDTWDAWIEAKAADAVPGAGDFIKMSQSLGFHVAFITNRPCRERPNTDDNCPQIQDTRDNLEDVGIDTASTTLFIRGDRPSDACREFLTEAEREGGTWSGDKTSRRECVSLDYEIVMLFGDQLGDFTEEDGASTTPGRELAAGYNEYWGKSWFMLPNPSYGGWRPRDVVDKRNRIRGTD